MKHVPLRDRIVVSRKWVKGWQPLWNHRRKFSFTRPGKKMAQARFACNHTFKHLL